MIHDVLVHEGAVPEGMIVPVSAHMLTHIKEYDRILESYSKPLMQRIRYDIIDAGGIVVHNPEDVAGYYKYLDLTAHCIYLAETIHATIKEDMPDELQFIQRYDEAKKALQMIVDMPDRMINQLMIFLHQNKGVLAKRRREIFSKLTDEEIEKMERAYQEVYELTPEQ